MKFRYTGLILLIVLLVPAVPAADITLTAEQKDYYFTLGQDANVDLMAENTFSQDVDGTIQFTITEQLQNTGTVMTSTQNRVYSYPVPAGISIIPLSGGTSDKPKTIRVNVAFDYNEGSPVKVTLPEIVIHFVETPPQQAGTQSQVTSTSGPGGSVPQSSSVQIVQQSVSVQQQAGRDGSTSPSLTNSQMSQDTNALKEQLRKEAEEKADRDNRFRELLDADPLVKSVNETLAADGFAKSSESILPSTGDSGTFSFDYIAGSGDQLQLSGAMEQGIVPSVSVQSYSAVNVTAPLAANTTYQSMTNQVEDLGFSRNFTAMNITRAGSMVNLTYVNEKGQTAFINATTDSGNVTSVSLAIEPETPADYTTLIIVLVIGAGIILAAVVLYRRYRRRPPAKNVATDPIPAIREPFDHRAESARLLTEAKIRFDKGQYPEAYGKAGRALRLFLLWEYGADREMTNRDLVEFLEVQKKSHPDIVTILNQCSDVEFARGEPDTGEFMEIIRKIGTITGDQSR